MNGDTSTAGLSWKLRTVIEMFARSTPEAIAIAAPDRRPLSYETLRLQVAKVADWLGSFGIEGKDRVAVVLPNGPEMAVAFLAISSCAGCAPLNPAYRFDEFDFYLADLKASALIVLPGTAAPAVAAAQKHSIPIIDLTPEAGSPAGIFSLSVTGEARRGSAHFPQDSDSALILHTSGTTSRPKMVALTHSQLIASATNVASGLELTSRDRCLNVMPLFHIHGLVGALLSSLMAGGSVVCTPGFVGEEFFQWLETYQPTWYTAVPTIHQAMLSSAKTRSTVIDHHSLRFIRSCSAPLPARVAMELEDIFGVPVVEAYGMTEAAHQIASNPLPPKQRKIGSVGLPTGTNVAVMDDKGLLLPREHRGEIVVRGNTVITAYAGAAADQDKYFAGSWFRTGDQGYIDHDGYVYLTGRLKEIINRGGEKISPIEIEEVLLSHPEISQAVAFRVPHPTLGDDVGAALVLRQGSGLTQASIRAYLLDRMAEFKVPGKLFIVDEIQKGATGKINRSKLSERFMPHFPQEVGALKNGVEEKVAEIYRDVLGAGTPGPNDNFFDLGGDSIRATQVINRVRALFEVNLSIATVFRKATVAELAAEIAETLGREN